MMESYGIGHLIFAIAIVAIPIWLTARIAGKAGFSGWWGLVSVIPLLNFIMIWVFAFTAWPAQAGKRTSGGSTDESFSPPGGTD